MAANWQPLPEIVPSCSLLRWLSGQTWLASPARQRLSRISRAAVIIARTLPCSGPDGAATVYTHTLVKGHRDRPGEDEACALLAVRALADAAGLDGAAELKTYGVRVDDSESRQNVLGEIANGTEVRPGTPDIPTPRRFGACAHPVRRRRRAAVSALAIEWLAPVEHSRRAMGRPSWRAKSNDGRSGGGALCARMRRRWRWRSCMERATGSRLAGGTDRCACDRLLRPGRRASRAARELGGVEAASR